MTQNRAGVVSFVALLVLAGCAARAPSARPIAAVVIAPAPAGDSIGAARNAHSMAERLVCPPGTSVMGAPPPDEYEMWCERPDGVREGPAAIFYESGRLYLTREYRDGLLDGTVEAFYENGTPWMETEYRAGKRLRSTAFSETGVAVWVTDLP